LASLGLDAATLDTSDWSSPFHGELVNQPLSLLPMLAAAALLIWLARITRRRRRQPRAARPCDLLGLIVGFLYLWTLAVSVAFELGEQARFRTGIDPVLLAALAVATAGHLRATPRSA
jgi:hypothetical protein